MTTAILLCEGCAQRKPQALSDQELNDARLGKSLVRYCTACHNNTHWHLGGDERRTGHDRRKTDRRSYQ